MLVLIQKTNKMEEDEEKRLFREDSIKPSNDIIKYLNASNAKKLAFTLILVFSLFHGVQFLRFGVDSCALVLKDGRYNGRAEWHPHGCMIHRFTPTDAKKCFKLLHFLGRNNSITFVGDSNIYNLYTAFLREINEDAPTNRNVYADPRLGLQIRYTRATSFSEIFNVSHWKLPKNKPSMVIVGLGISQLKDDRFDWMRFRYNITKILPTLDKIVDRGSHIIWASIEPVSNKFPIRVNNSLISAINYDTANILEYSKVQSYEVNSKLSLPYVKDMVDGYSLPWTHIAKKSGAQILLNVYCNDHMNFNDGNCCSSSEPATPLQIVTLSVMAICCIFALSATLFIIVSSRKFSFTSSMKSFKILTALGKLSIILAFIFVCDRTNFFLKESKYYSRSTFWIPILYVFIIGLFFTDNSRSTKILHRDQTDEWKGWMQMVILIYNWTDSMQVLPLYMAIRVLTSAYIFLSGYGHFNYFWHSADLSLTRLLQILFRVNFFPVLLCLVMNRPYQFYGFVPLISFWYIIIYLFFFVPPRVSASSCETNSFNYLYLVLKFVGLFGIITTLYMSEVFFEKIFVTRPWKALFVTTDDDIHEWWSRWKRDRYGFLGGMALAGCLACAQHHRLLIDDNHRGNLVTRGVALAATLFAAALALGCYAAFVLLCRDHDECFEIHAYAAAVPVIGYIVLRNVSGALRTRYSTFFAWFGRISLELYVGQAHIWLAGDSHGVLVLLPQYPHLNAIITSFIFVCIAHEMNLITKMVLPYAVPSDRISIGRNIILFITLLIPIGVHDGMF